MSRGAPCRRQRHLSQVYLGSFKCSQSPYGGKGLRRSEVEYCEAKI